MKKFEYYNEELRKKDRMIYNLKITNGIIVIYGLFIGIWHISNILKQAN